MQHIWTAATYDVVVLAYLVAIPRHRFFLRFFFGGIFLLLQLCWYHILTYQRVNIERRYRV